MAVTVSYFSKCLISIIKSPLSSHVFMVTLFAHIVMFQLNRSNGEPRFKAEVFALMARQGGAPLMERCRRHLLSATALC